MNRRPQLSMALAIAASLALWALLFAPGLPGLSTRFLGIPDADAYGTQWFYWFVGRALAGHQGFSHTDLFFFPYGKDIYAHTGANVLDAVVAQPFLVLLGPVLGYNVFCFFALLINGVAARPLVCLFAEDRASRVVGAALYALSPFLLSELLQGRPTQVFQPFLPLFFYHLLRFEDAGWKHALWAAVHLALTALTYWFYAIFAGIVAVVHFLQRAVLHPDPRRFFVRHALAGLLALAFVIPAALPLISSTMGGDTPGLLPEPVWPYTTLSTMTREGVSVGLYLFQPVLGKVGFLATQPEGAEVFFPEATVMTFAQVGLALLGLALSRHRWVLGAMLLSALLLSIGHVLWLGGVALPNPLYVIAVKIIPFMRRLWWPGRALVLVSLLMGVLAAAGLSELGQRVGRRWALGVGLAALALFGFELKAAGYVPFRTWDATIPKGYACLAQGPPGAIIELPYARSQDHLYYQTAHGRPLLGGMVEDNPVFTPAEQRKLIADNSYLHLIMEAGNNARSDGEPDPADKQALHDLGYRYLVVQMGAYVKAGPRSHLVDNVLSEQAGALLRRLSTLAGRPVYIDPDLTIFAPWGDPSPCGSAGTGRLTGEAFKQEKQPVPGEEVVIRPAKPKDPT